VTKVVVVVVVVVLFRDDLPLPFGVAGRLFSSFNCFTARVGVVWRKNKTYY
jgi:hypothetical protein